MDRTDIEELDAAECWRLLATATMGRLATATDRGVRIWPVNYRVREQTLIFRSDPGSKVWDIAAHPQVSFEIDGLEEGRHWSVVVVGRAEVIDEDEPGPRSPHEELVLVNPGPKRLLLRITPEQVTGRRFVSAVERSPLWNARPMGWRVPS
ncbi:pyridoxamine 5'-phosphate oxidase family protein [Lysinimonas soli]|uniref:Pyridoxamine 5'-phosphate oxidase family protein n=1 Tax=Lysinimonas soli TaxID=1074233 RepID=A0ABW0NQ44_9MICO